MLIVILLFLFGMMLIIFYSTHYVIFLLLLELILFGVFIYLGLFCVWSGLLCLFLFLLVMVCMGGYGMSLLVNSTRFFGRDFYVNSYVF